MTMMKSNKTHSILVYLYFFLMTTFIASRRYVSRFSIIMTRLTILTTSFFIFGNDILPVLFSTYSSRTATTRTIYFILTTRFSPTSNTMVTVLGFGLTARGIRWTILYSSSSTSRTTRPITCTPCTPWIPGSFLIYEYRHHYSQWFGCTIVYHRNHIHQSWTMHQCIHNQLYGF